MPLTWVTIPPALFLHAALFHQQAPMQVVHRIDKDLVVEANSANFTRELLTFRDGVRATLGQDVLTAESLVINTVEKKGQAAGNVVLRSPEGTLSAQDIEFTWGEGARSAVAKAVRVEVGEVVLTADKAESQPGDPPTIVFSDVQGTSCGRNRPSYEVRSRRIVFRPGQSGSMHRPSIYLFGKKLLTLPTQKFSLDRRVKGLSMPSLNYRRGKGIGVRWEADVLIAPDTGFLGEMQVFQGFPPTVDLQVTKSLLDTEGSDAQLSPRSDMEERFRDDYFNNVLVKFPYSEQKRLTERRKSVSLGASLNHGTRNDRSDDRYTKLLEAIYEQGGEIAGLGYQSSWRVHHIKNDDTEFTTRGVGRATVLTPLVPIANNAYARLRFDGAGFLGRTSFGWARGEAGIVLAPNKQLLLGGSFVIGKESGTAMFAADKLFTTRGLNVRADLDLGSTKISYLHKLDLDTREVLTEYTAAQAIGCIEVFTKVREFPRSYELGIKLRTEEFFSKLRSRKLRDRKKPVPRDPRIGPASGLVLPEGERAIQPN